MRVIYKAWTYFNLFWSFAFLLKLIVAASENGFWPRESDSSSSSLTEILVSKYALHSVIM